MRAGAGKKNNNPGNIRYVGQENAEKGYKGFARYETPEDGMIALLKQIELDVARGDTIRTFVYGYAPPSENNSEAYVAFMVECTGKPDTTPIAEIHRGKLARCVAEKESSTVIERL